MGRRGHANDERPPLGVVPTEWVGGRFRAPVYVTGDGPAYRPDVILWLDTGRNSLRAAELVRASEPNEAIVACLERAIEGVTARERPQHVRVGDVHTAELLRAHFGGRLQVEVALTPEIEGVLESMAGHMRGGEAEASYLAGGARAPQLQALFAAAAKLYRVAPWRIVADDTQLVGVRVPSLGLRNGCACVIGSLGKHLGLLWFQSVADFARFSAASEQNERGERPKRLGVTVSSLTYTQGSELSPAARREVARHGWEVVDARAYPWVQIVESDFVERPPGDRDLALAAALAEALSRFLDRHRALFDQPVPAVVSETYSIEGLAAEPVRVTISAPHPDAPWTRAPSAAEAEVLRFLAEERAEAEKLVTAFLASAEAAGAEPRWLEAARTVAQSFYAFKIGEHDGRAAGLTCQAVERFLLEHVPASVVVPLDLAKRMPVLIVSLAEWLGSEGTLSMAQTEAVRRRVESIEERFLRRVADPSRWTPAKVLMMDAYRAGLDVNDERAIRHFALERHGGRALKANEPCPCGSGRKYRSCCMPAPSDSPRGGGRR